ncbi:ATP-binding protein [Paractinoplanes rishiriensis]|uniref:ATP-binding protein n=1 Tax=Paractinoplanes rishiriensis TaxID=1050105 RepID=UPI001944D9D6
MRYPQHVEATAWYVLSEALTNVVKHAQANEVQVLLGRPDGQLTVEVRDDGTGFDPGAAGGLGLAGLADRMSIVRGTLRRRGRCRDGSGFGRPTGQDRVGDVQHLLAGPRQCPHRSVPGAVRVFGGEIRERHLRQARPGRTGGEPPCGRRTHLPS